VTAYSHEDSWDAIWHSQWFTRDEWLPTFRSREDFAHLRAVAAHTMPRGEVRRVLDCTSGMGTKSIVLAELGYEVEGTDASREGVRIARLLASAEGHEIPFRVRRWCELDGGPYDAVYSDAFDLAPDRDALRGAARGIRSVLRDGGIYVFPGAHQWFTEAERADVLERDWRELDHISMESPMERDGVRLTRVYVHDRVDEGITVTEVALWEEASRMRAAIAKDWVRCLRWSFADFAAALREAGFRDVDSVKVPGFPDRAPWIANVARA